MHIDAAAAFVTEASELNSNRRPGFAHRSFKATCAVVAALGLAEMSRADPEASSENRIKGQSSALANEGAASKKNRRRGDSDEWQPGADGRYVRIRHGEPPAQGQEWRNYDLRPYLERVRGLENPHQPILDWILRETGS
jgi:hypothetical protein